MDFKFWIEKMIEKWSLKTRRRQYCFNCQGQEISIELVINCLSEKVLSIFLKKLVFSRNILFFHLLLDLKSAFMINREKKTT